MKAKTGVFLINLGTPDGPGTGDVRKYLREFLMDGRVIDIPFWKRFLLVNFIIAPFRASNSSKEYQKLWTPQGSPLLIYGLKVCDLLQEALGDTYKVSLGMRYQNPSIPSVLNEYKDSGIERLIIVPLYPQYASASTGSTIEKVMKEIKRWETIPKIEIVSQFCDYPMFIEAFSTIGRQYIQKEHYDHILFTYHGLPERQIRKSSVNNYCKLTEKCCATYHNSNRYCYRAQCYQTTRLLAGSLGIDPKNYSVCFQSRLGRDPWIKPYTDEVITRLAKEGKKRILAFSPSFISDCLETTVEIGQTYHELFIEQGGEWLDLVPSLNDHPLWIECLKEMVKDQECQVTT